jgi:flagellar motor switch protein FliN/FliY
MSQMFESFLQAHAQAQPIELEESGAGAGSASALLPHANPLHAVKVRLQVCVGEADMSVGELLGARESEVVVLQRGLEQPIDLLLEGKVVARGQLVAVDGCFAVRISELPLPLKL